jgi:deoxyxylulose-5-phosphate synthase
VIGGFGCLVSDYYSKKGYNTTVLKFGVKDQFSVHGRVENQMSKTGLDITEIVENINEGN